jgi:hypothetical protein
MWSYESIMSQRSGAQRPFIVPLFVGGEISVPTVDRRPFSMSVVWLIGGTSLGLAVLLWWVWLSGRRKTQSRVRALPEIIDIKD